MSKNLMTDEERKRRERAQQKYQSSTAPQNAAVKSAVGRSAYSFETTPPSQQAATPPLTQGRLTKTQQQAATPPLTQGRQTTLPSPAVTPSLTQGRLNGVSPFKNADGTMFGEKVQRKLRESAREEAAWKESKIKASGYVTPEAMDSFLRGAAQIDSRKDLTREQRKAEKKKLADAAMAVGYNAMVKASGQRYKEAAQRYNAADISAPDYRQIADELTRAREEWYNDQISLTRFEAERTDKKIKDLTGDYLKENEYLSPLLGGKGRQSGYEDIKTGEKYFDRLMGTPYFEGDEGQITKAIMQNDYYTRQADKLNEIAEFAEKDPAGFADKYNNDEEYRRTVDELERVSKGYADAFPSIKSNFEKAISNLTEKENAKSQYNIPEDPAKAEQRANQLQSRKDFLTTRLVNLEKKFDKSTGPEGNFDNLAASDPLVKKLIEMYRENPNRDWENISPYSRAEMDNMVMRVDDYNKMKRQYNKTYDEISRIDGELGALNKFLERESAFGVKYDADGNVDTARGMAESKAKQEAADRLEIMNRSDRTAEWFKTGEYNTDDLRDADIAADKYNAYEYYEKNKDNKYDDNFGGRVAGNYKVGRIGIKSNDAGYESYKYKTGDIEASAVYRELADKIQRDNKATFTNKNAWEKGIADISQYIPQGVDQFVEGLKGRAIAKAAAAIIGGPVGAALAAGASAGMQASYMFKQTAGGAFVRQIMDNGLSPEDARVLAEAEAIPSTIVEFALDFGVELMFSAGSLAKNVVSGGSTVSTADKLIGQLVNKGMSYSGAKRVIEGAKTAGKMVFNGISEGTEEFLQAGMEKTADRYAKYNKKAPSWFELMTESFEFNKYTKEELAEMREAAEAGAIIGFGMGAGRSLAYNGAKNTFDTFRQGRQATKGFNSIAYWGSIEDIKSGDYSLSSQKVQNTVGLIKEYAQKSADAKTRLGQIWNAGKAVNEIAELDGENKVIIKEGKIGEEEGKFLRALSKKAGVNILVDNVAGDIKDDTDIAKLGFQSAGANTIAVDYRLSGEQIFKGVLMHESSHAGEGSKFFGRFKNYVKNRMGEVFDKEVKDTAERYKKEGIALSQTDAENEVAAEFVRNNLFMSEKELTDFVNSDYTAAKGLYDRARDIINGIKESLGGEVSENLEDGVRLFERVLATRGTAGETDSSAAPQNDRGEEKYMLTPEELNSGKINKDVLNKYKADVDRVLNGTYNDTEPLIMGGMHKIYTDIGLNKLPITIDKNHVYTIAKTAQEAKAENKYNKRFNYHGYGAETVKEIYEKLGNPIVVVAHPDFAKHKTRDSAHKVIAFVEISNNGKSVIAPIEIDATRKIKGQDIDVNNVATYFEKEKPEDILKEAIALETNHKTGFYYIDKKRAEALLKESGYQLPSHLRTHDSNIIIRRIDENVNRKIDTVLKSRQFIRFFGDWQNDPEHASKVVNEDGTPKIVYHGTPNSFTVFEPQKSQRAIGFGGNREVESPVFFFTENKTLAEMYGKNKTQPFQSSKTMAVYLNIRNPLDCTKKTASLIKILNEAGFDVFKRYGYKDAPANIEALTPDELKKYQTVKNAAFSTSELWEFADDSTVIDNLKKMGFDGIILNESDAGKGIKGSKYSYGVFSPEQIKSATDNIGTYDKNNTDINYSVNEITPELREQMQAAEAKEKDRKLSKLYESLTEKDISTDRTKEVLKENEERFKYTPISNEKTYKNAKSYVEENGINSVMSDLNIKAGNGKLWNASEMARAEYIFTQLQKRGRTNESVNFATVWREQATKAGQAVQAMAMINRLTPEGKLLYVIKNADKITEESKEKKLKNTKTKEKFETEYADALEEDNRIKRRTAEIERQIEEESEKENEEKINALLGELQKLRGNENTKTNVEKVYDKYGIDYMPEWQKEYAASVIEMTERVDSKEKFVNLIMQQSEIRKTKRGAHLRKQLMNDDITLLKDFAWDQVIRMAQDAEKIPVTDKIRTARIQAMLSGLATWARNVGANTGFGAIDGLANNVAVIYDAIASVFTHQRTVALDPTFGFGGAAEGVKAFKESNTRIKLDIQKGESKYELGRREVFRGIPGLAQWERMLGYALQSTDAFAEGMAKASTETGLKHLRDRGAIKLSDAAIEKFAEETALYRTFKDNNRFVQALADIRKALNFGAKFGIGDLVAPFVQVPGNIVMRGLEFSPLGYLKAFSAIGETKRRGINGAGQRKLALALGRATTGTGIILSAMLMASLGILTPEKDDEDKEKKTKALEEAQGKKGMAINLTALKRVIKAIMRGENIRKVEKLKNSDVQVAFDWFQPISTMLAMGAAINESLENEKNSIWDISSMMGAKMYNEMLSAPVFEGIQNLLSGTYSGTKKDFEDLQDKFVTIAVDGLTAFFPRPLIQAAQFADKKQRSTYTESNIYAKSLNRVKNSIPGLREALPEKVDQFGNTVSNSSGNRVLDFMNAFINPGRITVYNENPIAKEILSLEDPKVIPDNITNGKNLLILGEKTSLFGKELEKYKKIYGKEVYNEYSKLINSEQYKSASKAEKIDLLTETKKDAKENADLNFKGGGSLTTDVKSSGIFPKLSIEGQSKALDWAREFEKAEYKKDTSEKWIQKVFEGKDAGVTATDYILYKAALDMQKGDKSNANDDDRYEAVSKLDASDDVKAYIYLSSKSDKDRGKAEEEIAGGAEKGLTAWEYIMWKEFLRDADEKGNNNKNYSKDEAIEARDAAKEKGILTDAEIDYLAHLMFKNGLAKTSSGGSKKSSGSGGSSGSGSSGSSKSSSGGSAKASTPSAKAPSAKAPSGKAPSAPKPKMR